MFESIRLEDDIKDDVVGTTSKSKQGAPQRWSSITLSLPYCAAKFKKMDSIYLRDIKQMFPPADQKREVRFNSHVVIWFLILKHRVCRIAINISW